MLQLPDATLVVLFDVQVVVVQLLPEVGPPAEQLATGTLVVLFVLQVVVV
jgi:hypothetical protein